ncbi:MAG: hypothetical protein AAF636_13200 [Pseudomonadota bacterium]
MALIKDATEDWSAPIALSNTEIWQVREGNVFVSTDAAPEPDGGLNLFEQAGLRIAAGLTVRYRKTGTTSALIAREIVE